MVFILWILYLGILKQKQYQNLSGLTEQLPGLRDYIRSDFAWVVWWVDQVGVPFMGFRVLKSPCQVRKALVNSTWPDDPMSGQVVEFQGGSCSCKFADVHVFNLIYFYF